jgi:hypothetical protein
LLRRAAAHHFSTPWNNRICKVFVTQIAKLPAIKTDAFALSLRAVFSDDNRWVVETGVK